MRNGLGAFIGIGLALAMGAPGEAASDQTLAAFTKGDCARCHEVPGIAPLGKVDSCHTCHVWVKDVAANPTKRARALELFPLWERYERNVVSYLEVPRLDAAMARLDPKWVRSYLENPHDIRPQLPEAMPRFNLDKASIDAIVKAFERAQVKPKRTPPPSMTHLADGEQLFSSKGCASCHSFGGRFAGGLPMAPDLANARERLSADMAVAWIIDPKSISSGATMPSLGLTEDEAIAVRDFLWLADPQSVEAMGLLKEIQPLERPVHWAEVEEKVFGKICVHCHMDPTQNEGRAGPGNAGGFGWSATGIQLQTYEGVVAVANRIPDALQRRRQEAHRDVLKPGQRASSLERPEKPGMPLGLPPLPDEDISLVLGWIQQGMPR